LQPKEKLNMYKTKLWVIAAILLFCGASMFTSCSNDDDAVEQEQQEYSGVPLIIIDTDIGSSTDDLFTMMMLYRYQEQNRCRLLGVVVDREGEDCAACTDVMNTYYGYGDIPIGLIRDGIKNSKVWIDYKALPTHTDSNGKLMFQRSVADYSTLPDGWQLYRQLLAAQPDRSVSIVSIGFITCLAQLLQSAPDSYSSLDGVELVRRKVKCIYLMGGVFGDAIEPIEFADIDWTDMHPIKQVYMNYDCANAGQKMWDPLAAMNAVEGNSLFTLSTRGTVTVSDKGETFFTPSPTGNIRYQLPGSEAWAAQMLEKIRNANKINSMENGK